VGAAGATWANLARWGGVRFARPGAAAPTLHRRRRFSKIGIMNDSTVVVAGGSFAK